MGRGWVPSGSLGRQRGDPVAEIGTWEGWEEALIGPGESSVPVAFGGWGLELWKEEEDGQGVRRGKLGVRGK